MCTSLLISAVGYRLTCLFTIQVWSCFAFWRLSIHFQWSSWAQQVYRLHVGNGGSEKPRDVLKLIEWVGIQPKQDFNLSIPLQTISLFPIIFQTVINPFKPFLSHCTRPPDLGELSKILMKKVTCLFWGSGRPCPDSDPRVPGIPLGFENFSISGQTFTATLWSIHCSHHPFTHKRLYTCLMWQDQAGKPRKAFKVLLS